MKIIIVTSIFFFLITFVSCDEKHTKDAIIIPDNISAVDHIDTSDVESLIKKLNTNTNLEGPILGFSGEPSASHILYKQLVNIADDSTLLRLTFHENPKMKVYGMRGL